MTDWSVDQQLKLTPAEVEARAIIDGVGDGQDKVEELLMLQERCTDDYDVRAIAGMLEGIYMSHPELSDVPQQ